MSIAKEGYPYILTLGVVTIVLFAIHLPWVGGILLLITLFVISFFRDPERTFSGDPRKVLSPADGKVVSIRRENGQDVISIFLSVFNVHINRAPTGGKITEIKHIAGKFMVAYDERASSENERNSITIDHDGKLVRFVQIAGLVARRCVCWRKEGEILSPGERIGLIKFGSRVDVYFPPGSKVNVQLGQKVRAGESVIGELE